MPQNLIDLLEFTDPIRAPTSADPANAADVAESLQGLANRTRFLAERTGGVDGLGEFRYGSIRSRQTIHMPHPWANTSWNAQADGLASRFARALLVLPVCSLVPVPFLSNGLSVVDVMVKPGSARALGNRMKMQAFGSEYDFDRRSERYFPFLQEVEDDGTTNVQVLRLDFRAASNQTLDASDGSRAPYSFRVSAGATAPAQPDRVVAIRVFWTQFYVR